MVFEEIYIIEYNILCNSLMVTNTIIYITDKVRHGALKVCSLISTSFFNINNDIFYELSQSRVLLDNFATTSWRERHTERGTKLSFLFFPA